MTAPVASPNAPTSASAPASGESPLPPGVGAGEGRPLLTEHFTTIASAPNGIKKLRELILELAISGRLLHKSPNGETGGELMRRVAVERGRLASLGLCKRQKAIPEVEIGEEPFPIPADWEWVRLGETGFIFNGNSISEEEKRARFTDIKEGLPFIATKDVGYGRDELNYENGIRIPLNEPKFKVAHADAVLICAEGGSAGKKVGIARRDICFGNKLYANEVIAPIQPEYIFYVYQSKYFSEQFRSRMTGIIGGIAINEFISIPVPMPPSDVQVDLVKKIDEMMALCDQLEEQQTDAEAAHEKLVRELLATLTQSQSAADFQSNWQRLVAHFDTLFTTEASIDYLKRVILQLAVVGRLVPQGEASDSATELLMAIRKVKLKLSAEEGLRTTAEEKVQHSEHYLGEIPGWSYCRLGNLAKFIDYRGRTPVKTDCGVPLITAKNVRFGYISREPREYIADGDYASWMTRGFPRVGDVLFTTEAPLGNVALIDIEERFALAQRVICLQLHEPEIGPFLRLALMSGAVQRRIAHEATGMTATGIKASRLKEIPVPIPPLSEQKRIVAKVDELMVFCDQLMARVAQLEQLKERLASIFIEHVLV